MWIQHLVVIMPQFLQLSMQYLTILDRAIMALDSILIYICISEPPVCSSNVSGSQYSVGEIVSFTCTQRFHQAVWPPRMQWSWDAGTSLNPVKWTNGTMVQSTVLLEMVPEYNGYQLHCSITYDDAVPRYRYDYVTPEPFDILCK